LSQPFKGNRCPVAVAARQYYCYCYYYYWQQATSLSWQHGGQVRLTQATVYWCSS